MKTRYEPFVVGLLVVITGQQLQAQKSNSASEPSLQASAKEPSLSNGKSLDDVRESLQAKRRQTSPQPSKGMEGGEGAAEGGLSGFSGGSMGGLSGSLSGSSGMMSSGGGSMGMAGGSSFGAEGGYGGMGGPSSEKQKLIQLIQQLRERLKSKKHKREDVEKLLRSVLADYFQLDMEERVGEFDKVKARIAEMESKLQNRLDRQKEIIELQTLQILHKADGLDFVIPGGESGSGFGSMGMGMPGSSSMGMGMSGPGGMSGAGMGAGDGGGTDDLFGGDSGGSSGGSAGLSGGLSGGMAEAVPVLGYDIGFGATKHLRLDGVKPEPNDPLISYKLMNSRGVVNTSSNEEKMKSILNAMLEFHEVFQHLPGAINRHSKGQPPHSWRVALLPLLGHSDLYREYRFDEPWDSPSNSKLISKMPDIYSDTDSNGQQTNSAFYVITGEETAFPLDRPTSFAEITDGTSNTIGIIKPSGESTVRIGDKNVPWSKFEIPWTKPEDIEIKAAFRLLSPGGLVGFLDGVVFQIPALLPIELWRNMITRAGGEVINTNFQDVLIRP